VPGLFDDGVRRRAIQGLRLRQLHEFKYSGGPAFAGKGRAKATRSPNTTAAGEFSLPLRE
jgi:hypothetical protein